MKNSPIIQAGMGAAISCYELANVVARHDCLGTLTGVAADWKFARILQDGDPGGLIYTALEKFPYPQIAERVYDKWFINGGTDNYVGIALPSLPDPLTEWIDLVICANFVFVLLAKKGHNNPISLNLLTKIEVPLLYSIYGAMLAGVDFITMGAGIPNQIPAILDAIALGEPAKYDISLADGGSYPLVFDPKGYFKASLVEIHRPQLLPIFSSHLLAYRFAKRFAKSGILGGFVMENEKAGGHNAPPRGYKYGTEIIYGPNDKIDFLAMQKLDIPFWVAGAQATPEALAYAIKELGATGIQVGTLFALCNESRMAEWIKKEIRRLAYEGKLEVVTTSDSPTGFPIKRVQLPGTLSEDTVYNNRRRACNIRCLTSWFLKTDGTFGHRCPAESEELYVRKGGKYEHTIEMKCICNGLLTTAGISPYPMEPAYVTLGKDVKPYTDQRLEKAKDGSYSAYQVICYLLSQTP